MNTHYELTIHVDSLGLMESIRHQLGASHVRYHNAGIRVRLGYRGMLDLLPCTDAASFLADETKRGACTFSVIYSV